MTAFAERQPASAVASASDAAATNNSALARASRNRVAMANSARGASAATIHAAVLPARAETAGPRPTRASHRSALNATANDGTTRPIGGSSVSRGRGAPRISGGAERRTFIAAGAEIHYGCDMIVRDPVHGLVSFERPEECVVADLIDTSEVQRLRRIRMLGVSSLVFPGAEHSRFSHAVGTAHVMKCFLGRVRAMSSDVPAHARLSIDDERLAIAAAFLHDLGHGPLSHMFEEVLPDAPRHEAWTSAMVLDPDSDVHRVLRGIDPAMPASVERMVHGVHAQPYLAGAVSGTFDVDRCDYLLRDSHMTGVRYGLFDLEWLLRSLRLSVDADGRARLAVDGSKGLPAVEGFFLARLFMYQQVYHHKAARAAEWMIRGLFARATELARDGRPPDGFPTVLMRLARGETVDARAYASLDDGSVWSAIERFESSDDAVLADLSRRLRRRALFKTASVDDDSRSDAALADELNSIVAARGFDPRYYCAVDRASTIVFDEQDAATAGLRVVYQHRAARRLPEASFILARLEGQRLEARRLVFPREVRDDVAARTVRMGTVVES